MLSLLVGIGLTASTASSIAQGAAPMMAESRREVFLASPRAGVAVLAASYYTRSSGGEMISMHQLMSRSDTVDVAFMRTSPDHGRTWGEAVVVPTLEVRTGGKFRRALRGGVADPRTGRFVRFQIDGLLPTDDPLEGMRQWYVTYQVSVDGGRTWPVDEQVIQRGAEFSPAHPLPGVWVGKNCVMVGDLASVPIVLADGTLVLPVVVSPIGRDGNYFNPGGGYTYTDAAVLRGRWRDGGGAAGARENGGDLRIDWELSALVKGDPARSTRGMDEPTVAPLADGRLLMVLRGSNGGKPTLPGRRWAAWSGDAGRMWTKPEPWTYAGGGEFFSPSACSQLVTHSSGRLFWIGNIVPVNPAGNQPRTPLVIGEVDVKSGLLRKETVRVIDERKEGDSLLLALSNFSAREDRVTGEIVVHLSRLFERSPPEPARDWTSNAYLYRVQVK